MKAPKLSRRDTLRAIAGIPLLLAARARAGRKQEFAAGLARDAGLLAFATARATQFAAPLATLHGRLL